MTIMIVATRVDERLVHGQGAVSWLSALGADCILVANDEVAADDAQRAILKMAKPSGCKLVIKGLDDSIAAIRSGITDKYRLFIVVKTVKDACLLAKGCPDIKAINLGNVIPREGTRQISRCVYVSPDEEKSLVALVEAGVDIVIRSLPGDKALRLTEAL